MADSYATTADLAARLGMEEATAAADAALVNAIASASRAIDGQCGRPPGAFGISASATRYFTASDSYCLDIDEIVTLTTLTSDGDGDRVYEVTWATTDYDLEPFNASQTGEPYTKLVVTPAGRYGFPTVRKGVAITGLWGWPSVPAAITEATCLLAMRIYKANSAPFGVEIVQADSGAVQRLPAMDGMIRAQIAPYRKFWIGAV